jgi:heme/copper-type cytochrome/quinol oxidase subunit 2
MVAAVRRPAAATALVILATVACGGEPSTAAAPRGASPPAALPAVLTVEVTGDDYQWYLRYPGPDGELGTADDVGAMRDVHLPAHTTSVLRLHSRDFVYKLRLPHLGIAEIAVPEQEFTLEFDSGPPGTHELRGDQFCGFSHPDLIGTLHVDAPEDFADWMADLPPWTEGKPEPRDDAR